MGVVHLFRRVRSVAGVEPIIFLYALALFIMHLVQNQYIYVRFSEDMGFPYWSMVKTSAEGGCKAENSSAGIQAMNATSALKQLEIEVQSATARLLLYYVISFSPMLLVLPFWGSYTDRVGRKIGFVCPLTRIPLTMATRLFRRIQAHAGIEPVLFFYAFWIILQVLVQSQYFYVRISEDKGFPYRSMASSGGGGCKASNTSSMMNDGNKSALKALEIEVQREAANLYLYYIVAYSPMLLVLPFWGSYSDRVGRKVGIVIPLISAMIEVGILLLIMYLKLPIYLVLLSSILQGFTGNISAMYLSCMSYVADSVPSDKLSYRYAILQFVMFISATLSQLTSGLWITHLGFPAPMWFLLGCLCLTLVYVIFILQETRVPVDIRKQRFFTLESLKIFMRLFTQAREGGRRNLLMMFSFLAINVLTQVGTGAATLLFLLRTPLCWGPKLVGYFNAYKFFLYGLAPIAAIPLLKKLISEVHIIRIGFFFDIVGNLMFGFSETTLMVFMTPVASLLRSMQVPILLSSSSRIVGANEQGTLFAAFGQLNALGEFAGTSLFSTLYPISLEFDFPGFVFALSAGISLAVLLCTRFLNIPREIIDSKTPHRESMKKHGSKDKGSTEYVVEGMVTSL